MAEWWVRPGTSHSGTRNGTSYATAWGGWSEITWGVGGVVGGDTLYVCGAHSSATTLTVGAHGGGSGTECSIRGDYADDPGSIAITAAGQYFTPRSHTYFYDLDVTGFSRTVYSSGTFANLYWLGCTFNGGTNPIYGLDAANGTAYSDIRFELCEYNGGSLAAGGGGAAFDWFVTATNAVSTLSRLSIRYCTFNNCNANGLARSVVHLRTESDVSTSSVVTDFLCEYNTFTNYKGVAIEAYSGHATFGLWSGVRIRENDISGGSEASDGGGGAVVLGGFGSSATAGFGANLLTRNEIRDVAGPSGAFNLFYGSYCVIFNTAEDLCTSTIDANGILFDHGCNGCSAVGNQFSRLTGKAGTFNSGVGIMVLDATNCSVFGNVVDGALCGVLLGTAGSGQSCTIANNTMVNIEDYAVYIGASADLANCVLKNNIFVGDGYSVYDLTATSWSNEDYNFFYGFASGTNNHTLGANSSTDDPLLDSSYRLLPGSPCIGAGVYIRGARHFGGKRLSSPADIGAHKYFGDRSTTSSRRTTLTRAW